MGKRFVFLMTLAVAFIFSGSAYGQSKELNKLINAMVKAKILIGRLKMPLLLKLLQNWFTKNILRRRGRPITC